jgi:acetyl-CoA synthetase
VARRIGRFHVRLREIQRPDILRKIADYKVTTFCAPPTMYRFMIKEDFSRMIFGFEALLYGREALNPEVYSQWLKNTGLKILRASGRPNDARVLDAFPLDAAGLGSMGLASPGYSVIIADEEGK